MPARRPPQDSESLTLTIPAASRLAGWSVSLGYQLANEGRFPGAFRLGAHHRTWRVLRSAFEEGLARLANGQDIHHAEDALLVRAFDEARLRAARGR
jgi:predicted DNA-binding transcriptional regulator AlpA